MLSLKSGRRIAVIDPQTKDKTSKAKHDYIYLKEDDNDEDEEIDTTQENKRKIFKKFLDMDKKLRMLEVDELLEAYDSETAPTNKLDRKYHEGIAFVKDSLKTYMDYGDKVELFPIVEDTWCFMYVSGGAGSGKSTFISNFIKHNKHLISKDAGIFLFCPDKEDPAYQSIKNLIHMDLDEYMEENEGEELDLDAIPPSSTLIFDDIESYKKADAKRYMEFRDMCLERGRKRGFKIFCVSHNPMNNLATKVSIRECNYWVLFPRYGARDSKNLLKTYGNFEKSEIDQIMNLKTRWVFIRKSVPKYCVSQHAVIAY